MSRTPSALQSLLFLHFEDSFVRSLPGDPLTTLTPRPVTGACYSFVTPTPVAAPRLVAWSEAAAALLNVARPPADTGEVVDILGGNRTLPGMRPFAACYGGHQFGHWAGQLGDGRAISLTEVLTASGERWEIQLKGAGPTPYSRRADGRAVLRSSLREFLCSEAMHHLGVPTTRALSLVRTGDAVVRDLFYDGHPRAEPGAIVSRLAPSFVRFGNFELLAVRGENALLKQLVDYTITSHFSSLGPPSREVYVRWFAEVCRRTAEMVAHWMRVGFVHGVMNTDNMSILGLTLDYGPYGWTDNYDPDWTPNTTDVEHRRYRLGQQPRVAYWNLTQLAQALVSLVDSTSDLEQGLDVFVSTFDRSHGAMMAAKLGLLHLEGDGDDTLLTELFALLRATETDFTIFFRHLADIPLNETEESKDAAWLAPLQQAYYAPEELSEDHRQQTVAWLRRYVARTRAGGMASEHRRARMNGANPCYVLRNYLAQQAIEAAENDDTSVLTTLLEVLQNPYEEQPGRETFAAKRPEWARHKPGCSALSCSS